MRSNDLSFDEIQQRFQRALFKEGQTLADTRIAFDNLYLEVAKMPLFSMEKKIYADVPIYQTKLSNENNGDLILFLHGGGFTLGSSYGHSDFIRRLFQQTNTSIMSIDYRLAPEHPYPAALEDCKQVYMELLKNYSPDKIIVVGMTAGGTLALSLLLTLRDAKIGLPKALVCLSPPTDLTFTRSQTLDKNLGKDWVIKERLLTIQQSYLAGHDPEDPICSPLLASLENFPSMLLQVGGNELLYDDVIMLAQQGRRDGVDINLSIWPNMFHGWHMFASRLQSGRDAINEIATFIKNQQKRSDRINSLQCSRT